LNAETFRAFEDTSGPSAEYSETNVQVEGVDEADIVKTDGECLYVVAGQEVIVAKAYPAEEVAIIEDFGG